MVVGGVAFGANESYLFFCGEGTQHHFWAAGLPVSLQKYFDDKKVKKIFQAALGPDGSYYMYYQNQAEKCQVVYDQLPPELNSWIFKPDGATNPGRHFASMEISLGPNKSFFAFDKNGRRYHNLPAGLELVLQAPPSKFLMADWMPSYVTLGSRGSYFLHTLHGGGYKNLSSTPYGLKDFMQCGHKPNIVKVTLSPSDHNNYVVTSVTGTCTGIVPLKASRDFVLFSLKWAIFHPAITEVAHNVIVDNNRQVLINQIKTLQQKPPLMKSPAPKAQPAAPKAQPTAPKARPAAPKARPAAPKKSASEKFATGLGIANGMINLIIGVENLENNQNNQNNQNN